LRANSVATTDHLTPSNEAYDFDNGNPGTPTNRRYQHLSTTSANDGRKGVMRCFSLVVQLAAFLLLGCHAGGGDRVGGVSDSLSRPALPSKSLNGAFGEASRDSRLADPTSRAAATEKKSSQAVGSSHAKTDQTAVSSPKFVYPTPNLNPVVPAGDGLTGGSSNRRPFANTFIDTINALQGDGLPLNSPHKATDPAILFRVRGNDAMLLLRYRF